MAEFRKITIEVLPAVKGTNTIPVYMAKVGCKTLFYATPMAIIEDLTKYFTDPDKMEAEVVGPRVMFCAPSPFATPDVVSSSEKQAAGPDDAVYATATGIAMKMRSQLDKEMMDRLDKETLACDQEENP